MNCCSHNGSSTTLPKNAPYASAIDSVLVQKLRRLNDVKSTIGCFSVSSQTTKIANATTATTTSTTMRPDSNQSSSLPLSSAICNAPTHRISNPSTPPS